MPKILHFMRIPFLCALIFYSVFSNTIITKLSSSSPCFPRPQKNINYSLSVYNIIQRRFDHMVSCLPTLYTTNRKHFTCKCGIFISFLFASSLRTGFCWTQTWSVLYFSLFPILLVFTGSHNKKWRIFLLRYAVTIETYVVLNGLSYFLPSLPILCIIVPFIISTIRILRHQSISVSSPLALNFLV